MLAPLDVDAVRARFPALARRHADGRPVVYFDGPAGSQVPAEVIDAVAGYLRDHNANTCGPFAPSRETDAILSAARAAVADLLGAPGADAPDSIVFGPNMTTLTLSLGRALARTWRAGDEVVVTRLDHDANVWPWVLAAEDAGAVVRYVDLRADDCTLDLDALDATLSERTRLVAVGAASNAVGTVNPVAAIAARARAAGAQVFVDAVHYAPHRAIDVAAWGCDYLACSAYKFFGPHVGILWGRAEHLRALPSYQVRPAQDGLPGRWMTGTQSHEGIAGTAAAIEYLASLGRAAGIEPAAGRRRALVAAFDAIAAHEQRLTAALLAGLADLPGVRVRGVTDPARSNERVATIGLSSERVPPAALAATLGERGIHTWAGHFYAVEVIRALDLEPHGLLRIGLLHYNTLDEVDRLLAALRDLLA